MGPDRQLKASVHHAVLLSDGAQSAPVQDAGVPTVHDRCFGRVSHTQTLQVRLGTLGLIYAPLSLVALCS